LFAVRPRRPPRDGDIPATARTPDSPKALAVRWLARRDYSRAELAQRLRQRGVVDADIERALDELAAAGYLSDARYANAVVAQRKGRYGKRAIVHALKERGIGADESAGALAQLADVDELEQASALWQQRFGVAPANEREKARQVRFLQARGYGLSVALAVLRAAGTRAREDAS
jgi:regulatory protein